MACPRPSGKMEYVQKRTVGGVGATLFERAWSG